MTYMKQLPKSDSFQTLARLAGPYPVSAKVLCFYAWLYGLNHNLIDFLHLFHPDDEFESRIDFVNRCEELELFIAEERNMPKEKLLSPQD